MKKYILFSLFLFFPSVTWAAGTYVQSDGSDTSDLYKGNSGAEITMYFSGGLDLEEIQKMTLHTSYGVSFNTDDVNQVKIGYNCPNVLDAGGCSTTHISDQQVNVGGTTYHFLDSSSTPIIFSTNYWYLYINYTYFDENSLIFGKNESFPHDIVQDVQICSSCSTGTNLQMWINADGVPQSPEISFAGPGNGSTTVDFLNWRTYANNLVPGESYQIRVLYGQTSSTIGTYMDPGGWFTSAGTSTTNLIFKQNSLVPFSAYTTTSIVWYARPVLYSSSTSYVGPDISFTVVRSPGEIVQPDWTATTTVLFASTTLAGPNLDCGDVVSSSASFARNAIDYSVCSLKKGAIGLISFLFVPDNSVTNYAISELTGYRQVFPFSLFFGTFEEISSGFDGAAGTSNADTYLTFNIQDQTSSLKIASPTYLVDAIGMDLTNILFNFIIMVFGLLVMMGLLQGMRP